MAIHVALLLALLGSLGLAATLREWADQVAGARLLIGFLAGIAVWIVGNELPTWLGPDAERPGLILLGTAATNSAVFFHFAVVFSRAAVPRAAIGAAYAAGLTATLACVLVPAGGYEPFAGVARMAVPNTLGWIASAVWAGLAAAGQGVLLRALLRRHGLARRQMAAVTASSAWGLFCMSGYGIAALRLPIYPWPLLLLPAYPVILVYGILRYRVLVANAWARRALVWAMLAALAVLAVGMVPLLPLLPLDGTAGRLLSGALVAMACLALAGPARRLAERMVYPGGVVSAEDLRRWQATLARAETPAELAHEAAGLLTRRLGVAVHATVGDGSVAAPGLRCAADGAAWRTTLVGWDAAPPGPRHLAELFGAVLAEEAARLQRAASLADRERERQTQARLAELGQLAAAVAHDIRNPLNIIGMAAATAAPETRAEIRTQIDRIAGLSRDLLDYARPWQPEVAVLDLVTHARAAAERFPGVEVGTGLTAAIALKADPRRLDQALTNLLANACATGARVALDADAAADAVCVHVCDAGPGIPQDVQARLFQPFVSRTPGGTGLGLAIVARIMAAHGGTAQLTQRAGWTTCVTLAFPA